jgi:GTP-binding protein YchF
VPDPKLAVLAQQVEAAKITQATIDFIDIAGLVAGASEGKGLGNKFLANIASVHSIVHVVRCFEDESITHVEGSPDPVRDLVTIEQELIFKDLNTMEGVIRRRPRGNVAEVKLFNSTVEKTMALLEQEQLALNVRPQLDDEEKALFDSWRLLSAKPILIACNVDENSVATKGNHLSRTVQEWAKSQKHSVEPVVVSAKLESELMILEEDPVKRQELFKSYGMEESALTQIIRSSYQLLDLITFYTAGPTEARAWSVMKGSTAKECAGEIHTDIAKGFVKAETYSYDDFVTLGEKKAKEMNKLRLEGPGYIAQEGDIFLFKFKGAR